MINMNVVISAAGMGTRLGLDIPKCLLQIGGESFLARQLKQTMDCAHVYVVVGFKEEEVIAEAFSVRKDVIIVRNPIYMATSNAYSLSIGSKYCKSFLALDGDVWFPDNVIDNMLNKISKRPERSIVFATPKKTEDAVYMILTGDHSSCFAFSRDAKEAKFEWSGCGYYHNIKIHDSAKYVYEELVQHLPLASMVIDCWEVDTPADLDILKNLTYENN